MTLDRLGPYVIQRELGAGGMGRVFAATLTREHGSPGVEVLARGELACLPGEDVEGAIAAVTQYDRRFAVEERSEARQLLWKATGDRTHLEDAKRQLDDLLAKNPREYHESMLTNLRVSCEILAACAEQGI